MNTIILTKKESHRWALELFAYRDYCKRQWQEAKSSKDKMKKVFEKSWKNSERWAHKKACIFLDNSQNE